MAEWKRETILDLIKEYKQHTNLYDSKHSCYYNKKARSQSMKKIADAVCNSRPGTTNEEIHKKIQTLRTQIGQELGKIEKSKELGDDALIYTPKVWWYESLEWVTAFMKRGIDQATPVSSKFNSPVTPANITRVELFNDDEEEEPPLQENFQIEEITEEQPSPKRARKRTYAGARSLNNDTSQQIQTIQYIISQDDTTDNIISPKEQPVEIQTESPSAIEIDRCKKRSKGFGKYVASLMQDIKDDKLFFATQSEILQIIEQATLKSTK